MPAASQRVQYIAWQNRAFRFYIAARRLSFDSLHAPAAFCSQQALECLLKATLIYHDKSFDPETSGHRWSGMLRAARNKVRGFDSAMIPPYMYAELRFQSITRYPHRTKGVLIPGTLRPDLDRAFADLVTLVPFQFNSELVNLLSGRSSPHRRLLVRGNPGARRLQAFLRPWYRPTRRAEKGVVAV